jgi:Protein of unknown function (DUF2793)
MSRSTHLDLPYLLASQADKHITFNEAIANLDELVQLSVLSRSLTVQPLAPIEGARYLIPTSATGAWSSLAGKVTSFRDGGWHIHQPEEGWQAWVVDEAITVRYLSGTWEEVLVVETLNPASLIGVNTQADANNRLAVKSEAVLLSHEPGGTGDMRLKLNKSQTTATGSVIFQSNWSGRAEIGLAGDNAFRLKVSSDGATFQTALCADPITGMIELPGGLKDTASGKRVVTLVPVVVKDIWRSDMDALPSPRTYVVASVAGNAITITTNEVEQLFNTGMRDASMVRIWNTTKSPAQSAWINWNAAANVFLVHNGSDVASWAGGDQLRLGDPNPTGTNALQMVALDISNYLFNTFGRVFPQRGLKMSLAIGGVGGRASIDCSGTGAVGSAFGVGSGSDGNRQGCFVDIFTNTLSPISNSNLLFVRESISGSATGVMAIRSLRLAGIWV